MDKKIVILMFMRKYVYIFFVSLMVLCGGLLEQSVWAMSVQEAYNRIPHRRTVFDPQQTQMSSSEKVYLQSFFHLVDQAIVQRVELLTWLLSANQIAYPMDQYENILSRLDAMDVPEDLLDMHDAVMTSIEYQREFLENWKKSGKRGYRTFEHDPDVQEASYLLKKAYSLLMTQYPNENQYTKNAFFDYLCALDFI